LTRYSLKIDENQLEIKLISVDTDPTLDFRSKGGISAGAKPLGNFMLQLKEHLEYKQEFNFALEKLTGQKPRVMPTTSLSLLTDFWFDSALSEGDIPPRLEHIIRQKRFRDFLHAHRVMVEKIKSGESPIAGHNLLPVDANGLAQIDNSLKTIDALLVDDSNISDSFDVSTKEQEIAALTDSLLEKYSQKQLSSPAAPQTKRKIRR
jgi:hypothetical protein